MQILPTDAQIDLVCPPGAGDCFVCKHSVSVHIDMFASKNCHQQIDHASAEALV